MIFSSNISHVVSCKLSNLYFIIMSLCHLEIYGDDLFKQLRYQKGERFRTFNHGVFDVQFFSD